MTDNPFTDFFAAEDKAAMDEGRGQQPNGHDDATSWADPDMGVPGMHRRSPAWLPIEVFGPRWSDWIIEAADAAACPNDYVMGPLVAAASALIGNSRWAQATAGWSEPPHLWGGAVGDSGNGKSPGADCLTREVLPEIERRMIRDYPDRLQQWRAGVEYEKVIEEKWKSEVREAQKRGAPAPLPPVTAAGPEPKSPRLRQHDVTIEKVAALLGTAAPKGLTSIQIRNCGSGRSAASRSSGGCSPRVRATGRAAGFTTRKMASPMTSLQSSPLPIRYSRAFIAVSRFLAAPKS